MSEERLIIQQCPVCGGTQLERVRDVGPYFVERCRTCGLQITNPQPSDEELGEIYGSDYFLAGKDDAGESHISALKQATARHYLDLIERSGLSPGRRLLEIGCGHGDFLDQATHRNFAATGLEFSRHACAMAQAKLGTPATIVCGGIDAQAVRRGAFDLCVICDVLEHVRRPAEFLQSVRGSLAPRGVVFVATPSSSS